MAGIGAILGVVGSVVSAMGTIAQANAAVSAAKAEQKQLSHMAAEKQAVATRDAQSRAREARLLLSRQQAVAASSGGGATDPTVMELAGGIAREANVGQREAVRQGQEEGRMLNYKGYIGVKNAEAQKSAAMFGAFASVFSGVTGAFAKYGSGMPTAYSAAPSQASVPSYYYG